MISSQPSHPFKVESYAYVGDDDGLERELHNKFAQHRPNKSREFFEVEVGEAGLGPFASC